MFIIAKIIRPDAFGDNKYCWGIGVRGDMRRIIWIDRFVLRGYINAVVILRIFGAWEIRRFVMCRNGWFVLMIGIVFLAQNCFGGQKLFKVGFGAVDFTPAVGEPLHGNYRGDDYASRGVHDRLMGKAVVFSGENGVKAAMLSVDLCMLGADKVAMMREYIAERCDIKAANILIHTTHTHSGPNASGNNEVIRDYLQKAASAVIQANKDLKRAKLFVGHGREDRVSFCRRLLCVDGSIHMNWEKLNPDFVKKPCGVIDPEVVTLAVERNGERKTAIVNFANHPAILAGDNWLYSADYPGYLAQAMEKLCGDGFLTLFFNGCCGNVNHIDYSDTTQGRGYQMTQRVGYMVAAAAFEAMRKAKAIEDGVVMVSSEKVKLNRIKISAEQLAWAKAKIAETEKKGNSAGQEDGIPDDHYARQWVKMYEKQDGFDELEVMVLRIGDVGIVAFGGEIFAETGLRLKELSPAEHTIVIERSNADGGYFPTAESFDDGAGGFKPFASGYETTPGTTKYEKGAAEKLMTSALKQLRQLFGK
jgi:hypothetical protein